MHPQQVVQLRAETPGCQHLLHFNNAGAALPAQSVLTQIKDYLDLEAQLGGYEAAELKQNELQAFYTQASALINCQPTEIAFVENATRAWDMAFYSLSFKPGDRVITAISEYGSNYLALLQQQKRLGIHIDVVQNDHYGQLDLEHLQQLLNKHVKLIAITHVPSQGGLVNPAKEVGKIAQLHKIPYLLDATQSIGQMPIDVAALGCDFLCATGRKFLRGPRGTGFLYANKNRVNECEPPFIDLQSATWLSSDHYQLKNSAQRFETWEQNYAGKRGLTAAISYALEIGLENIWHRIHHLGQSLRKSLKNIPSLVLQDLGKEQCGIITFNLPHRCAEDIKKHLQQQRINVSISYPEYAQLDFTSRKLPPLVRASVHYYNTEEEIEKFCEVISQLQ